MVIRRVKRFLFLVAVSAVAFAGLSLFAPPAGERAVAPAGEQGAVSAQDPLLRARGELLCAIAGRKGDYVANSIVLQHTTASRAHEIAAALGAKLRITADGSYAQLSLADGTELADVFTAQDALAYLPEMDIDWYAHLADITDGGYSRQTYLNYLNKGDVLERATATATSTAPLVAVIDSGIDTDNHEFSGRISKLSYNATTDETVAEAGWGAVEDEYGHGTQVASVLAAAADGADVVGIVADARILAIKCKTVLSGEDKGSIADSDIAFGIYYAAEHGADVINLSLCSPNDSYTSALEFAQNDSNDAVVVAAAGNAGEAEAVYPASNDGVVGVGALASGSERTLANYSNFGPNTTLVAPGTVYTMQMNGACGTHSGTSFACPIVAGAAARYRFSHPNADAAEVVRVLECSSVDIGDAGRDERFGFGRLDMLALLDGETGIVTFDANAHGAVGAPDGETRTFTKGHILQDVPTLAYAGKTFGGWYRDAACTKAFDNLAEPLYEDATVYALWKDADDSGAGGDGGGDGGQSGGDSESGGAGDDSIFSYALADDGTATVTGFKPGAAHAGEVVIPDALDGHAVTAIGKSAFAADATATSFVLPDTVVRIGALAFANSTALTAFTLPKQVTSLGGSALANCTALERIEVEAENPVAVVRDNVLFTKDMTRLITYPAGLAQDSYTVPAGVTRLDGNAFFGASRLGAVVLPDSVTSIGVAAFYDCTALSELHLPASLTRIKRWAFYGCSGLEVLEFAPNSSCTRIDYSAFNSTGITSLRIPASVSSLGNFAFNNCPQLSSVTFEDASKLVQIPRRAFSYCEKLASVDLGAAPALSSVEAQAFRGSRSLTSMDFSECRHLEQIGDYAFYGCSSLMCVELPDTTCATGSHAFSATPLSAGVVGHDWDEGTVEKEATATESGIRVHTCLRCKATRLETIAATGRLQDDGAKVRSLESGSFTCVKPSYSYTGTPLPASAFRVKVGASTLAYGTDYTVRQASLACGKVALTATGKGGWRGTLATSVTIVPAKMTGVSVRAAASGRVAVKWSTALPLASKASGYIVTVKRGGKVVKRVRTGNERLSRRAVKVPRSCRGKKVEVAVQAYKRIAGKVCAGPASKAKRLRVRR